MVQGCLRLGYYEQQGDAEQGNDLHVKDSQKYVLQAPASFGFGLNFSISYLPQRVYTEWWVVGRRLIIDSSLRKSLRTLQDLSEASCESRVTWNKFTPEFSPPPPNFKVDHSVGGQGGESSNQIRASTQKHNTSRTLKSGVRGFKSNYHFNGSISSLPMYSFTVV